MQEQNPLHTGFPATTTKRKKKQKKEKKRLVTNSLDTTDASAREDSAAVLIECGFEDGMNKHEHRLIMASGRRTALQGRR